MMAEMVWDVRMAFGARRSAADRCVEIVDAVPDNFAESAPLMRYPAMVILPVGAGNTSTSGEISAENA